MTSKILEAYIEYLEYPTIVVKFESLGFYSIDDFIEEGARLKKENDDYIKDKQSWFGDMPFLGRDDATDASQFLEEAFRREHLGIWDRGNDERSFEETINFDTSLSAGVITSDMIATGTITSTQIIADEITPHTVTQFPVFERPFVYQPTEPPDTPCYRKYLNEIREKEVANKFLLRSDKFYQNIISIVNLKRKFSMHKIRAPTHRLIDHS